jgi:hypothetical protein
VLSLALIGLSAALLGALPALAAAPYAADFGDAPDGQNAGYGPPFAGVMGNFPTRYATVNSRYGLPGGHAITSSLEKLGLAVSSEFGPDDAADPDTVQNLIDDDFDDGLVGGPCPVGTPAVPWPSPLMVNLSFRVTVAAGAPNLTRYINILVDGNHDGAWSAPGEWVAIDRPVLVTPGTSAVVSIPVPFPLSAAGSWMRVSLTRSPVVGSFPDNGTGWDGSGAQGFGEFEDYMLSSATSGLDHASAAASASARAAAAKSSTDFDYDSASARDSDMALVDVDAEVSAAVSASASASTSASAAAAASASASASASAAAAACASALASAGAFAAACVSCPCATVCGSAQAYALAAAEACAQAQVTAQSSAATAAFASASAAAAAASASSASGSASASAAAFSAAYASASASASAIASAQASASASASASSSSAAAALAAACGGDVVAAADASASAGASAIAAASAMAIAVAQADANARAYANAEAEVEVLVHVRTTAEASATTAQSSQSTATAAAIAASTAASTASGIATSMTSASAGVVATCSGDCCPGGCGLCWSLRVLRVGVMGATINWGACSGAISYDLLAGTLGGGPTYCLAENSPNHQGSDPGITVAPGHALFYLHRTFSGTADDTLDDATNTIPRVVSGSCSTGCDAAICNDNNVCTTDGCDGTTHQCTHTVPNCDDSNPCTRDTCHPATGCQHTPITGSCNDGSACTTGDVCSPGGLCGGAPVDCNDNNPCTAEGCNPASGCTHAPQTGPVCNDQSVCTTGDHCTSGICGGTPQSCDDGNGCTTDSCNPQSGCHHSPHSGGCSDGNACTTGDSCTDDTCVSGPPDSCDDGNSCTFDFCSIGTGCQHQSVTGPQCDDGNACTIGDSCNAGNCQSGPPIICDDLNPCTVDLCTNEGCLHGDDNNAACSDGNPCSAGDHCQGGLCSSTGPETCDDGTTCTDDFCTLENGCQHIINDGNTCDDANSCTTGDHCSGGVCQSNPVPPSTIPVTNPAPIGLPTSGQGTPYPSTITIPPRGAVVNIQVRLQSLTHPFPDDIDVLLVGPQGQTAVLMSDVGGNIPVNNINLVLFDAAANPLSDNGPLVNSGPPFRPTNIGVGDTWPAPAPPTTGGALLNVFNGTNPTGVWSLYAFDDQSPNAGQFALGWQLVLTTQCLPSFAQGGIDSAGPPGGKPPSAATQGASAVAPAPSTTQPPAATSAGTGR